MPHWKKRFASEHLEACDLDGKAVTITIKAVSSTEMKAEDGSQESKGVIHFEGKKKTTWVYPVTVGHCLSAMFGENDDGWIGKRVTIHSEKVESFGETVDAIRPLGSPDISAPIRLRVRMGRKKVTLTMNPTGKPRTTGSAPAPQMDAGEQVPPVSND